MRAIPLAALLCFWSGPFAPLSAQLEQVLLPMRDWTSSDGKSIRAELLGREGDSVRLRLEGGQRALVPRARLSPPDLAELLRLRFRDHLVHQAGEAANTNYYASRLTPEGGSHKGIAAIVSVGPNRFLFELKIHSEAIDLRTYDRIELNATDGSGVAHNYRSEQVASWGTRPAETTRVVIQIQPEDGSGVLPVLGAGLAEGGALEVAASRRGVDRVVLPLDETGRAALADLLSVFLEAQPLLVAGVIKKAPLGDQTFAQADGVATPPSAPSQPAPGTPFALSKEEESALARMASGRGSGRFGGISWAPAGDAARTVGGLGWIRDQVVVREGDGGPVLVPFSEIGREFRGKLLGQRLSEFSGNRPPSTPFGTLYFPEDWNDHRRESGQGLVFGKEASTGRPFLLAQGVASKFGGGFITELAIRGDAATGFLAIPVDARANRTERTGDTLWTYARVRIDPQKSAELAKLAGVEALDIRITSMDDSLTFPLTDNHLRVSLEALRCYRWAAQVP